MKTIVLEKDELKVQAAEEITRQIAAKPGCVLALSYDETLSDIYAELVHLYEGGKVSLMNAVIFQTAELEGTHLIRNRLMNELLLKTDADTANFFSPDMQSIESYDELIASRGGIDIAVLDLGYRGQVAFNEPATLYSSLSHCQKLTDSTKEKFAFLSAALPEYGCTMGIHTLVSAKNILIAASGEKSADGVFGMLYGRDDGTIPAAFLQLPLNVTVYADAASAEKL